jgi:hypothetical protein
MESITGWDIALFVVAGYVAVMSMARLMIRRRNELLAEFRAQIKTERKRKEAEEAEQARMEEAERRRGGAY